MIKDNTPSQSFLRIVLLSTECRGSLHICTALASHGTDAVLAILVGLDSSVRQHLQGHAL